MENDSVIHQILQEESIPRMVRVRQTLQCDTIPDIARAVHITLNQQQFRNTIKPGMSIAITAGSRGIYGIDILIRETVSFIKSLGGIPFVIPAMGSHGGATSEGQVEILSRYGITEQTVGAPIRATMETTQIGLLLDGTPVFIDKFAAAADGIVVVNRIKCHTGFRGRYESGLLKMMSIGLGKQYGAQTVHGRGAQKMSESIELFGKAIISNSRVLFGLATIENAIDKPFKIIALTPQEIIDIEPQLLDLARSLMPRILFDNLDIVIVDYFGKEISGAGVDPNITKTYKLASGIPTNERARQVLVLD